MASEDVWKKNPVFIAMQVTQAYNAALLDFATINVRTVFKFADNASKANSPQQFADFFLDFVRDQFEATSEQVEEFSARIQKAFSENSEEMELAFGD